MIWDENLQTILIFGAVILALYLIIRGIVS
jgi:hypothetical protein